MEVSVSLFTSPSKEGIVIENFLKKEISKYLNIAIENVNTISNNQFDSISLSPKFSRIKQCSSDLEFSMSQLDDDIIIFDGSIEDDSLKLGDNYSCVGHAPYLNKYSVHRRGVD